MKFFLPIASLFAAVLVTATVFTSCQKDSQLAPETTVQPGIINSRGPQPVMYGVTTLKSGVPCVLATIDPVAETILGSTTVTVNGNLINDLKGVCIVNDQVYVTTGFNAFTPLSNLLLRVDPVTGVGVIISQSTVGTVSDIDYNPITGNITGLRNNSNQLVTISGAGFPTYATAGITLPLSSGNVASGLTWVRGSLLDPNALALKIAAPNPTFVTGGPVNYYEVPAGGGTATYEATLNPVLELGGGNAGLGYISSIGAIGRIFINKNGTSLLNKGLNRFDHSIPLANPTLTLPTTIQGLNFEDLSTTL